MSTMISTMTFEVNFFMCHLFRYLINQPQPINNAIYNIQEKVYHMNNKGNGLNNQGHGSIHGHHQFSIKNIVNNVWKTRRMDRCDK